MLRAQGAGVVPCVPRGSLKPQRKPVFELPWGHGCVCVRARAFSSTETSLWSLAQGWPWALLDPMAFPLSTQTKLTAWRPVLLLPLCLLIQSDPYSSPSTCICCQ